MRFNKVIYNGEIGYNSKDSCILNYYRDRLDIYINCDGIYKIECGTIEVDDLYIKEVSKKLLGKLNKRKFRYIFGIKSEYSLINDEDYEYFIDDSDEILSVNEFVIKDIIE